MLRSLVGSEMCIRDRYQRRVRGTRPHHNMQRASTLLNHVSPSSHVQDLQTCQTELHAIGAHESRVFIRLAALDAMTGAGADGSIVQCQGTDTLLDWSLRVLRGVKSKAPRVSWADLIQMARAVAVEKNVRIKVPMRYGRVDAEDAGSEMGDDARHRLTSEVAMALKKLESEHMQELPLEGLEEGLRLALAGDLLGGFKHAGEGRLIDCPSDGFANQHILYSRSPLAFSRDYVLAHAAHSEIGAVFSPKRGLRC
eukprot:TRINITY_DN6078_c0_g1_i7.p1 TRINITY_DN6078_c0_g1~~TRINITY_DN6078_c0_g1_i7.p1  ORF type:complete len:254 (+),score=57.35 TRINITY_DN6078_c0_g1_i7:93-854(+)